FIEKFQEVKESTRSAAQHKTQANGSVGTPVTSSSCSPCPSSRSHRLDESEESVSTNTHIGLENVLNAASLHQNDINALKSPLTAHQRSQSLSGLQANKVLTESPKHHKDKLGSTILLPQSTTEAQLRYENDRLKLALAQSSANAKKWEIELQTLKNNNSRLTNALQESTANVEEWKKQLQALKDENSKMRLKVIELEASHGNPEAIAELRKEIGNLRTKAESLDVEVKQKDKEIELMKERLEERIHIYSTNQNVEDKLKMLLNENENLRTQLNRLQDQSDTSKVSDKAKKSMLDQLNVRLALNIQELRSIQQELTALLNTS
ncbi:homer protein 1-like protein, partial [Dinothrombium tinctorium]